MLDFVIIGAAQAGLSMAYHLDKMNKSFVIVDKGEQYGSSWLNRWDSLKLFTPTEYNHLPGLKFDLPKGYYPNKYEVADYFQKYAEHFKFEAQFNTLITNVAKTKDGFLVSHESGSFATKNVIIATGPFHTPYTPPCNTNIATDITQIHSNYYKSTDQLQEGNALVVGGGDSGYQILNELSKSGERIVYFSGDTKVKSIPQQFLGKTLWWWFTIIGFLSANKYSWIGKKISNFTQPVIGTDVKEILARANVVPVGFTKDAFEQKIFFEKTVKTDIRNVIWATGYRPNFQWIEGLELDKKNYPINFRGVSNIDGLYFIGLPWMYTRGSATLGGVSKDAKFLAKYISKRSDD